MAILPLHEDILPMSEDYVLKSVLTHPEAKPALMDLITTFIHRKVTDVEIRNNELHSITTEEKNVRLDLNCVIDDGSQVDVEMQGSRLAGLDGGHEMLVNKSVYYLTDLHSSQKSKGIKYNKLVRTYQITFCVQNIFKQNEYITEASLRTEDGTQISNQINLTIIELGKLDDVLNKPVEEMSPIEMWSTFLRYSGDRSKRDIINKVLEKKGEIGMAGSLLASISQDDRMRAINMSQRKWQTDYDSNFLFYKEQFEEVEEELSSIKAELAEKNAELANKDAENEKLRKELLKLQSKIVE
ncbi:MAG: Rpn family recombination-promoting nuclease/putative transposase [Oscillospiraceae bacterium]|jgi:predicted transposase/invertase (TIGR01784 family)|nr:Rpn family recombination-promoting nuclease/putative transposase [Oscillospiraceae bacterium]